MRATCIKWLLGAFLIYVSFMSTVLFDFLAIRWLTILPQTVFGSAAIFAGGWVAWQGRNRRTRLRAYLVGSGIGVIGAILGSRGTLKPYLIVPEVFLDAFLLGTLAVVIVVAWCRWGPHRAEEVNREGE